VHDRQFARRCGTDTTSRNRKEDTGQSMPSPKWIVWRGFNEIAKKHAHKANRDSPLLFDESQQGHDEGVGGSFAGTTSDGINGDDKYSSKGTAAPSSKNLF
jgi:hypothetical protein